jgi:stearoyl-CoA desaturase (delta-9 desaturase)
MALQGPVIWWAAVHRQHHKYTDQRGDPHTPYSDGTGDTSLRGLWYAHLGWLFDTHATQSEGLLQVFRTYTPDLLKDEVTFSVHLRYWECVVLGLALPAVAGALWYGNVGGALQGLIWGGLVRIFLVSHAFWTVNSLGHTWGRRPFKVRGNATNLALLAIPTLGESWHNNHHAVPYSARIGLTWWQIDIGYLFIRALEVLGLVSKVRSPSQVEVARKSSMS